MIPAARMRPKARTALLAAALSGLAALAAIPPAVADRDHLRGPADPVAVQATQADSIRYSIRVTDDNLMGITITNYGFVGNNFTSRSPSLEYPLGSGFEHMVRGGLWIGANAVDDSGAFVGVTTAAVDGSQGNASAGTTEFTPAGLDIKVRSTLPNNRYFTWAYVLGPGALSYLAQAAILLAAAAGAYLNRRASTGRLLALGILAGAVGATYWHLQDFTILVGAAWLFWRDNPPAWQRIWMVATAVTIELAWPLTPLPLLIATAVWLGFLVYPANRAVPAPA